MKRFSSKQIILVLIAILSPLVACDSGNETTVNCGEVSSITSGACAKIALENISNHVIDGTIVPILNLIDIDKIDETITGETLVDETLVDETINGESGTANVTGKYIYSIIDCGSNCTIAQIEIYIIINFDQYKITTNDNAVIVISGIVNFNDLHWQNIIHGQTGGGTSIDNSVKTGSNNVFYDFTIEDNSQNLQEIFLNFDALGPNPKVLSTGEAQPSNNVVYDIAK